MADFYCDGNKVIIKDALKDCRAAKCYVIVSPNLFAHYYRGANNELKVETFKGITDKDEYTFMMETDRTIYTAEFETNGGSNIGKQSFFEGELIRRPSDPMKKGYTFEGWYLDAQCTVKFDFAVRVYEDITIYAKWKKDKAVDETVIPETTESNKQEESASNNRYYSSDWKYEENGQWKCYDSQGKPLVGYHEHLYWEGVEGNWFFDENGNMLTGWVGDRYFNESSNGMKGAEITDDYVKYYINSRSKDAASQIGGYLYSVQFVGDLDGWTKFGHSLRNWSNTFSAVKGGIQSVLLGEATDWSSAIADAYMKDPVANKSILADIVNEMFSTEAWTDELGDSYKVFKNLTKTERSFVTGPLSKDYWTELESYTIGHIDSDIAEKLNIHDPNGAKGWDAFFKTLKTIGDASEEFQKAFTDYSRNIAYLESLAQVAPKEGVLSVAINDLIEQYKNQVAESLASVFVLQRDLIDAWGEVNGIEGYDSMLETGDYWLRDSMVSVVDKLTDLKFGKVDKVIQLVTDNVQEITATDKVVYSAYLRSEAIQALRKAQEKAKSGSTSDMANYKSAFECAKAVTITQYENMVKYYSGNAYQKSDRQKKIAYLQDEISKLKEMNFWDYDEYNPASYPMFQY